MKDLLPRIISGSVYIGLVVLGTTMGPWIFAGLMAAYLFRAIARRQDKNALPLHKG